MTGSPATGVRLVGEGRQGRAGRWWRASTVDGGDRGALLLDAAAIGQPGVVDRVVATVVAVRGANLPGVLPIVDLVADAGNVWLLTAAPAEPTVAELLGRPGLDGNAALVVAADTGHALSGLHQAGVAHDAVGPDTVVVTAEGAAALIEVGLAGALRGAALAPADDEAAWAALARTLAGAWARGPAADLLHRAAAAAESAGLEAALAVLAEAGTPDRAGLGLTGADRAGPDRASVDRAGPDRAGLARAASGPRAPHEATLGSVGPASAMSGRTLLPAATLGAASASAAAPADQATRLGRRAGGGAVPGPRAPEQAGVNLRFGPGVASSTAAQTWRGTAVKPRRRRRRLRAVLSGLMTLAIAVAVGYVLLQRRQPIAVTAAAVAPAEAPGNRCDITVDVVGTIRTNGRAGTVTYQWLQSDGQVSAVLRQSIAAGTTTAQVHLYWSFSGRGTQPAKATLKILNPEPTEASANFTYACR